MGEFIYIRKLFTQDLRDGKQIAFPREPAEKFFNFRYWIDEAQPRKISFTFSPRENSLSVYSNKIFETRLYAAGTKEARMDGEVKAFLRDDLHAEVDDYVEFRKQNDNEYSFDFISRKSARASLYETFCEGRNFHTLVLPHIDGAAANLPPQRIIYGAPGTGKSHGIEDVVGTYADTVRTTFHPDSDYSTFVGSYKPTMTKMPRYGQQGMPIKNSADEIVTEDVITYSFVPQAFTKAYVRAWSKLFDQSKIDEEKRQYLVIEEINRGNCAQIFGDLFQLLDRKGDGYSKYPIESDTDLARYVGEELGKLPPEMKTNIPAEVLSGAKLVLPPNLYIWATMNTSDQSLFPMDSAFKRRWEWEYVPIKNAGDEDPKLVWKIVADGEAFSWWNFLKTINKCILDTLKNEDKQLGYFFARPDDDTSDVIPASKFVNKILFYLYNDVFKDYELPKGFAKAGGGKFAFADFFLAGGKTDETKVKELLSNLLPKSQQAGDANE